MRREERGSSKRLNATAKEIQSQFTKLEKEYEDMEEAVTMHTDAIITLENEEVEGSRENQIAKLE